MKNGVFKLLTIKNNNIYAIELIHALLVECGKTMHEKYNLNHWHPFMDLNRFKNTMQNKNLYAVYEETKIVATFNLNTIARDYYCDEFWSNPAEKAIYLGQLAIHPIYQNSGIGTWCMEQVEQITIEMNCKSIRFDGVSNHPYLKKFYEKLGYTSCCTVKPGQWELTCFEKMIL
jgi:GNAT superfamily N-acetyltransferase